MPADDFILLIVSSPSGAGKTTLCNLLRAEMTDLQFSVSHTTREPRPGEVDGREYHFVGPEQFMTMVERGSFLEWAPVHGYQYGTSRTEIERAQAQARGVIFDIDFQGARQIRAHLPQAVTVFILPPTLDELERRLRGRGTEAEDAVQRRLANAKLEIAHYGLFDYVVLNDDLDLAYARLKSIVTAERCRRQRHAEQCEALLTQAASSAHRTSGGKTW